VNAPSEAVDWKSQPDSTSAGSDLETIFRAHYERIARVIRRVIHDSARAEELAVEVFLKWSRTAQRPRVEAHGEAQTLGWLYRTSVRIALDELRRETRRSKYERLLGWARTTPTPEDIRAAREEQQKVRATLNTIGPRHAELLVLRSQGLSYEEIASALDLNPASVGTLLSRAQQAFRKEYIKRYGEQ
jgi:RNA polymerase sigma-70 factor, ECF subfamily